SRKPSRPAIPSSLGSMTVPTRCCRFSKVRNVSKSWYWAAQRGGARSSTGAASRKRNGLNCEDSTMAKDVLAKFALDRAQSVIEPDGELELKDVRDNVADVRYRVRKDRPDCSQCVMGPNDL